MSKKFICEAPILSCKSTVICKWISLHKTDKFMVVVPSVNIHDVKCIWLCANDNARLIVCDSVNLLLMMNPLMMIMLLMNLLMNPLLVDRINSKKGQWYYFWGLRHWYNVLKFRMTDFQARSSCWPRTLLFCFRTSWMPSVGLIWSTLTIKD